MYKESYPKGMITLTYCTIEMINGEWFFGIFILEVPGRKFCFEIKSSLWNDEKDFILQAPEYYWLFGSYSLLPVKLKWNLG